MGILVLHTIKMFGIPLLVKKKQDFWVIDRINDQEDTSINLKEYHFTNNETRFITL